MLTHQGGLSIVVETFPIALAYGKALLHETGSPVDCILEYVNPAFEDITGLSSSDLIGQRVLEVFLEFGESNSQWMKTVLRVMREGTAISFEQDFQSFRTYPEGCSFEVTVYSETAPYIILLFRESLEKKRAGKSHDQEHFYKHFFIASDDGIVRVDTQGRITYANPAFCAMTGYSLDELRAMESFKDLTPRCWWQWEQEEIWEKRLLQEGSSGLYEKEYIRKDGTLFPVELQSYAIKDEQGAISYLWGFARDITKQKGIEQNLRESQEKLRVTLNSIGDAVLTTSTQGTVMSLNPLAEKLTGWREDEARGKKLSEVFHIVHTRTRAPVNDPVQEVLQTGKIVGLANDTLLISRDGHEYQIADSAAPIQDNDGATIGVVLVFRDVTEEYNRQQELQKSRERLNLAMAVANDGLWDWDLKTNTTYFDPRYYTMAGYEPNEFPHDFDEWKKRVHEEDLDTSIDIIQAHLTGETKKFDLEFRFRRKDNTYMWIQGQGKVVKREKDGTPLRMVGTHKDITEKKEAEQKLKESEEQNRLLLSQMHHGLAVHEIICDEKGTPVNYRFLSINRRYQELTGLKEDIIGRTVLDVLPNTEPYWIELFGKVALTGESCQYENFSQELGKWYRVSVYSPRPKQFAVLVDDITERKKMEKILQREKEQLKITLLSVADAIISTDSQGNILVMNKVAEQLTGWTQDNAYRKPLDEVFRTIHEKTREPFENSAMQVLKTGEEEKHMSDTLLLARDGREIPIEESAAPILNDSKEISGVVLVFRDCTERKRKQEEIEYLSYHDYLTGLFNRRAFDRELRQMDVRENLPLTVLMLDVNGLKLVNEAFGHSSGDEILKKVAQVLGSTCRSSDLVARIGSDEFIVLLPSTEKKQGLFLARRIQGLLASEKAQVIPISISCGLDAKVKPKESILTVLQKAEDSMYREKISERTSKQHASIQLMMKTLYEKIPREQKHSIRVSQLCGSMGQALKLSRAEINNLVSAGSLHDIGKVAISNEILNKVPPLTAGEWEELKRHAEIGYSILSEVNDYALLAESVVAHHERWDGSGYPKGLKGNDIPLFARIMAIADAYDAMTSDRPYRKAMKKNEALEEIRDCSGGQFDPLLGDTFLKIMEEEDMASDLHESPSI